MSLPDLFKRQGALASLRPANIHQLGSKQQHEEERKPQLLQRWEQKQMPCQHAVKGRGRIVYAGN